MRWARRSRRRRPACRPRPARDSSPAVRSLARVAISKLHAIASRRKPSPRAPNPAPEVLTSPRDDCVEAWFDSSISAPLLWGGAFFFAAVGMLDQAPARAALLRPAHPADPQQLLRRQHLALPPHRSAYGHRARQPGSVVVRGGAEAARRAAHLRQLSAAAAAAEVADAGARCRSPINRICYDSEIQHTGGNPIAPTSDAYYELKRWLDNGANRDGLAPPPVANMGKGACNTADPARSTADRSHQPGVPDLHRRAACRTRSCSSCAFATCHSSPQSDFYMTCGDDDAQKQYNFSRAASFVAAMGIAVEQSEILLRPLAPAGRRRQPHRRRLLRFARRRRLEVVEGLGRAGAGEPALHADQEHRASSSSRPT